MITIPKQDKTTISLTAQGLILIEQEDTGESQRIFISPQLAGRLIEGIRLMEAELGRMAIRGSEEAPGIMVQTSRKVKGLS